jgi:hypothetical protein
VFVVASAPFRALPSTSVGCASDLKRSSSGGDETSFARLEVTDDCDSDPLFFDFNDRRESFSRRFLAAAGCVVSLSAMVYRAGP